VVRPGALYTLEVLAEGQEFSGELSAPPEALAKLQSLLTAQPRGWLGTAKSRGLGEVELTLNGAEESPGYPLATRLRKFNEPLAKDGAVRAFSLTLLSDAILLDELLGYRSQPTLADLQAAAGIAGPSVLDLFQPLLAWTGSQRVSGWQAAWQLPKPEEQASRRGSVFVFGLKDAEKNLTTEEEAALLAALNAVEVNGLGERPTEGFGRLRCCHEFHWENPLK
jgi:CRISPR-associated protein Csx10